MDNLTREQMERELEWEPGDIRLDIITEDGHRVYANWNRESGRLVIRDTPNPENWVPADRALVLETVNLWRQKPEEPVRKTLWQRFLGFFKKT